MKIYSWNVNGLRAIIKKNFYEFVESEKPDILCLQETKISDDLVGDFSELPFKYKIFNCAERKGYSGTAILSNIKPVSTSSFNLEGHPFEGRISAAEFDDFMLVSAYVPNSQSDLARLGYRHKSWDVDFANYLKGLGKRIIVCGDFNVAHEEIDLARPNDNHFSAGFTDEEREGFGMILETVPLVDIWRLRNPDKVGYTWWSYRGGARARNVGWRIDYFLVSPDIVASVEDCGISAEIEGSDHCPVWLKL